MRNELIDAILLLEEVMPQDWLTPDLRMMVATTVVEWAADTPWAITLEGLDD